MRVALLSNVNLDLVGKALKAPSDTWIPPGYGEWVVHTYEQGGAALQAFEPDQVVLVLDGTALLDGVPDDEAERELAGQLAHVRRLASSFPHCRIVVSTLDFPARAIRPASAGRPEERWSFAWRSGLEELARRHPRPRARPGPPRVGRGSQRVLLAEDVVPRRSALRHVRDQGAGSRDRRGPPPSGQDAQEGDGRRPRQHPLGRCRRRGRAAGPRHRPQRGGRGLPRRPAPAQGARRGPGCCSPPCPRTSCPTRSPPSSTTRRWSSAPMTSSPSPQLGPQARRDPRARRASQPRARVDGVPRRQPRRARGRAPGAP